jgi:hypothetical protein
MNRLLIQFSVFNINYVASPGLIHWQGTAAKQYQKLTIDFIGGAEFSGAKFSDDSSN